MFIYHIVIYVLYYYAFNIKQYYVQLYKYNILNQYDSMH